MKKFLIFLIAFLIFMGSPKAESVCSYQDQSALNKKAANISRNYTVETKTEKFSDWEEEVEYFNITILNITEDFYVTVSNDVDDIPLTYYYSDTKDGVLNVEWEDSDQVTSFTIQVYSSDKTNCPDELYKTLYLTTPRYNEFSNMAVCDEASEFSLCQRYVTFKEISYDSFLKRVNAYLNGEVNEEEKPIGEEENPKPINKILNFLNEYKWPLIIIVVLLVAVGGIIYYNKRSKKKRELGL